MKKSHTNAAPNTEGKGNEEFRLNQLQRVRKAFMQYPKTMRQVATELGEERENVCRYCKMMRDLSQIQVIYRGPCMVTGLTVNYYSTDEALFKPDNQLKLFEEI